MGRSDGDVCSIEPSTRRKGERDRQSPSKPNHRFDDQQRGDVGEDV